MAKNYEKDSIQVLSDLDHIRQRRGMYIGEANDPRQLLSEIFDNAIDEVQSGYSSELIVEVNTKENIYTVRDFGRGIPHGKKTLDDGTEKEIIEILLTKSNSGGKFNADNYICSSGLNGLGLTVTNALSNFITITSYRNGKYVKGYAKATNEVTIEYGNADEPNGTIVVFQPNAKMFHSKTIPTDFIIERCNIASALGFKARLFIDSVEQKINASIFDLIKEESSDIATYVNIPPIEVISSAKERMKVAIKYTSDTSDRYLGYTNLLSNYLGGTHVQELSKTIATAWKEFVEEHKKIKPAIELKSNDYLIGLRAVCAVFISHPEFSSQTKEKLVVNKKYFDELMEKYKKQLKKYLEEHIDIAQQLLKRFEEYRLAQNSLLSRKEISSIIKVNTDTGDNIRRRSVVSKLVECTTRKRDNSELFIVEGDSALGPYKFTRNKETQAVLPLRGKILNITNKSVKEAIKNNEICDIANAIGAGIGNACDASKSRYGKIIISADSDPDGSQITCLLLSLFVNMFPDLIKQGRIYIARAPLYCWENNKHEYFGCDNIADVPKNVKNFERIKGLGEFNNDQLAHFLVNPETRNLLQVEYPSDIDEFNRIMGSSSGKNKLLRGLGILQ